MGRCKMKVNTVAFRQLITRTKVCSEAIPFRCSFESVRIHRRKNVKVDWFNEINNLCIVALLKKKKQLSTIIRSDLEITTKFLSHLSDMILISDVKDLKEALDRLPHFHAYCQRILPSAWEFHEDFQSPDHQLKSLITKKMMENYSLL